jgi:hypothetical protein
MNINVGFKNLTQVATFSIPIAPQPLINGLFGLAISSQEAFEGLFKIELYLVRRFHVENANGLDPFKWWVSNKSKFLDVGL